MHVPSKLEQFWIPAHWFVMFSYPAMQGRTVQPACRVCKIHNYKPVCPQTPISVLPAADISLNGSYGTQQPDWTGILAQKPAALRTNLFHEDPNQYSMQAGTVHG